MRRLSLVFALVFALFAPTTGAVRAEQSAPARIGCVLRADAARQDEQGRPGARRDIPAALLLPHGVARHARTPERRDEPPPRAARIFLKHRSLLC